MAALLVKSRVALAQGRVAEAADLAERADAIAEVAVEPLYLALIRAQLARVEHARGHSDQARSHLRAADAVMGEDAPAAIAEVLKRTGNDIRFARTESGAPVELSERERAVLHLLPHGLTRKQLGEQLFVSENTIKTYLTSLRHKLGVTGRSADIVQRAHELGLLDENAAAGSADT
jgi:ATP/maltotriose-dependent transcriptional regulator MalT